MNRIALVEDHVRLAGLIRQALQAAGIPTDVFHAMEAAWVAHREVGYAALVIDRGLPDGDGLALVKRLRAERQGTPCLMLTARDALHDRIDGLESGADDYLAKPFPMEELVARVRALMRRPAAVRPPRAMFGDIEVDVGQALLLRGATSVALAPAELQIAITLVQQQGRTVRRAALEAAAWGLSEAVTPNALDVALHRLRKKLASLGSSLRIVNLRNHGYALQDVVAE
ncbi:two-component system response regulator [Roseateles chitinivorans]|uniref:Two-component system response regulator n=1 Tax=Roseateles chitinivorans TaxID=2917965 RepID=A0A2G9C770_9BURK|nr:response regulator transcription factor [Roseateles chitinivorans]PIM52266.1 two-component system response regulator [Roseateles chitinivorans]